MVGNMWVAGGSEENGVFAAEIVQSAVRHHYAVLAVVVSPPVEVLELEVEGAAAHGFHYLPAGGYNFFTDSVSRHGGDAVGLHALSPQITLRPVEKHFQDGPAEPQIPRLRSG